MCIHCGAPGDVTREAYEREIAEQVDEETGSEDDEVADEGDVDTEPTPA